MLTVPIVLALLGVLDARLKVAMTVHELLLEECQLREKTVRQAKTRLMSEPDLQTQPAESAGLTADRDHDLVRLPGPDGSSYEFIAEVPRIMLGAAREQYLSDCRKSFLAYAAKVQRMQQIGTPIPEWFRNSDTALRYLQDLVAQTVQTLYEEGIFRQGVPIHDVIIGSYLNPEGSLLLPGTVFALSHEESAGLLGVSPLRLIPLHRESDGEFQQWHEWHWDLISVVRDAKGSLLGIDAKPYKDPPKGIDLIAHVWLWYFHLDSNLDRRSLVALNVNPVFTTMVTLTYSHKTGRRLDATENEEVYRKPVGSPATSSQGPIPMPNAIVHSFNLIYKSERAQRIMLPFLGEAIDPMLAPE